MLHISFDASSYCNIKHAMKLKLLKKDNILPFNDDLSVGDISNCREYVNRKNIIHNIIYNHQLTDRDEIEIERNFNSFYQLLLNEDEFTIWYSNNPRDYCNLYYLVTLLINKKINIVDCTNYNWVDNILYEDLPSLYKNIKTLTLQDKIMYNDKWSKLVSDNELLRTIITNDIVTVNENYYDNLILNIIPKNNIRVARIVGEFIGNKPFLRDWFIVWRIKQLVSMGCIVIEDRRLESYTFNNIRRK
jgi:hypothetical protein